MSAKRARTMWAAGVTVAEIAERLEVTRYQARQWVRDDDEEPRAPGLLPLEEHDFVVDLDYRRPDEDDAALLESLADHQFEYEEGS